MDYSPPGSSVHEFSRQVYWSGLAIPFSRGSFSLGIQLGFPALQADSLPSEPPGGAPEQVRKCEINQVSSSDCSEAQKGLQALQGYLDSTWHPLFLAALLSMGTQDPPCGQGLSPILCPGEAVLHKALFFRTDYKHAN